MGWNTVFADLLINLAAGWLGAIFIVPNFAKNMRKDKKKWILFQNFAAGIVCLSGAYFLRNI